MKKVSLWRRAETTEHMYKSTKGVGWARERLLEATGARLNGQKVS